MYSPQIQTSVHVQGWFSYVHSMAIAWPVPTGCEKNMKPVMIPRMNMMLSHPLMGCRSWRVFINVVRKDLNR